LVGKGIPASRRESGRAPSLLAIHGFGGTPREVDLLVDVAQNLGLRASAPLLPGHGTHVRDLARYTFDDWLASARVEFEELSRSGDVIVAGLSLGAAIAARLAAEFPVRGLALLGNALWLNSPYPAFWLSLVGRLRLSKSLWVPKLAPDIESVQQRAEHLGYDAQLITAAVEVFRGGREARLRLGQITCPTLLIHGALDKVCPIENVQRVTQRLGTRDVRSVILERSGHIVTRDSERAVVAREFEAFLSRLNPNCGAD